MELFRKQMPLAPHLPPAVIYDTAGNFSEYGGGYSLENQPNPSARRDYLPPPPAGSTPDAPPPRPRFSRSVMIRAMLSVPHSDYTEPYTAW